MKYLIFGSNGMAGHIIALYLMERGHNVIGFSKEESKVCKVILGNALCEERVRYALELDEYDAVINCIGVLNKHVDDDKAVGIYINSVFPHILSQSLRHKKTKLIHISTDCVFKGDRGNYIENSVMDSNTLYGKSKALGEIINDKDLTLRTSIIGPELSSKGIGLYNWFMNQNSVIKGYQKVNWTGVTTLHLAKAIEAATEQKITGLYHLVNNEMITKYDLLCLLNKYCRKKKVVIQKDYFISSDKSLFNNRIDFLFEVPNYEKMIFEMSEWIIMHPDIYAGYTEI